MASARSPSPPRRNSTAHGRLSFDSLASPIPAAYQVPPPPSASQPPAEVVNEQTPLLEDEHDDHDHAHGHTHGGHAHGSMNMQALLLHVLGDALGNVGVIATGLIIWLTTWKYKYYCDPVISLVITAIIFSSALPLGM
jgi:zinc transporter 1